MSRIMKYITLSILLGLLAACSPEAPSVDPPDISNQEQVEADEATLPPTEMSETAETALPLPTRTPFPALPITSETLAGNWLGALYLDEKPVTLSVLIKVEGGTVTARPRTVGQSGSLNGSEGTMTLLESENSFSFDSDMGREGVHQFTGQLRETGIDGNVMADGKSGSFYLIPLVEHDELESFVGLYRFEDGRTLSISPSPSWFNSAGGFLTGLWLVDHGTGAYRAMSAVSKETFYVGPSLGIALPATDRITFQSNDEGKVESLMMLSLVNGQTAEIAMRQNFPTEDITFENEGADLAGTVTLPLNTTAEAPFPAVVLVHGSGRTSRDHLVSLTHLLVGEGFAVLGYDKRGVGESGGIYSETASESRLLLLASDAAAGVEYMRGRPDINTEKIGLLGISQAGWIIPAAAVQSGNVAFMVNLSGPVVTVGQEGVYSAITGNGAIEPTMTDEEISEAVLNAASRGFDPRPYIFQLEIPGLWLFGAKDRSIPIGESVDYLQEIIDEAEKPNFSYTVFPNGDHALWESETGSYADWPYIRETVPGYFDVLKEWLRSQL